MLQEILFVFNFQSVKDQARQTLKTTAGLHRPDILDLVDCVRICAL